MLKELQTARPDLQVVGIAIDKRDLVVEFAGNTQFNYPILIRPERGVGRGGRARRQHLRTAVHDFHGRGRQHPRRPHGRAARRAPRERSAPSTTTSRPARIGVDEARSRIADRIWRRFRLKSSHSGANCAENRVNSGHRLHISVAPMARFLLLNGPNLGQLGRREPGIYGTTTLADIEATLRAQAAAAGHELDAFQATPRPSSSNASMRARDQSVAVILFNPAAFTHTSVALRDALLAAQVPFIELHLSNVAAREGIQAPLLFRGHRARHDRGLRGDELRARVDGRDSAT